MRPTNTEIVNGGAEVLASFVGTKEATESEVRSVFVRIIPPRSIRTLALAWGNEEREIGVYLGVEPTDPTVAGLDADGWDKVITEGRRLNAFSFARYLERSRVAASAISGQDQGAMNEAVITAMLKNPEGRKMLESAMNPSNTQTP